MVDHPRFALAVKSHSGQMIWLAANDVMPRGGETIQLDPQAQKCIPGEV